MSERKPDPEREQRRIEALDRMAAFTRESIEQEWAVLGKEPLTVNRMVISPSLAKQLRGVT